MNAIPAEIAHLDFAPRVEAKGEITPGKECAVIGLHRRKKWLRWRRTRCHNLATWKVTLRCCMLTFPCCERHRISPYAWVCPQCGHSRGNEWMAWRPLS